MCTSLADPGLAAPKASDLDESALDRLERQDMAGAIIQLKNALRADKKLLPVHRLPGKAWLASGKATGAETTFEEALRLGVNRVLSSAGTRCTSLVAGQCGGGTTPDATPEPSSLALVGLAIAAAAGLRRRQSLAKAEGSVFDEA